MNDLAAIKLNVTGEPRNDAIIRMCLHSCCVRACLRWGNKTWRCKSRVLRALETLAGQKVEI